MYWDVKKVRPMDDYQIYVELEDGRKGVFDLKPYLDHGVFRELKDTSYFSQVDVVFGAVTWPHEQDIAPETLLAGLKPVENNPSLPYSHLMNYPDIGTVPPWATADRI